MSSPVPPSVLRVFACVPDLALSDLQVSACKCSFGTTQEKNTGGFFFARHCGLCVLLSKTSRHTSFPMDMSHSS